VNLRDFDRCRIIVVCEQLIVCKLRRDVYTFSA
jgi:hypothetical protein